MTEWLLNHWGNDVWAQALAVLIDCGAKGMALLALGALAAGAMRRSSAAARHLAWALALGGLLLLPALALVMPQWQLPILPRRAEPAKQVAQPQAPLPEPRPASMAPAAMTPSHRVADEPPVRQRSSAVAEPVSDHPAPAVSSAQLPLSFWVLAGWLAGALAFLAPLAAGLAVVARLRRKARRLAGEDWPELTRALASAMGVSQPVRYLCAGRAMMPMATGLWRPAILLPEEAEMWPEEKRRAVLLHELAHVRRRDCLSHALARVAVALHWFNPLAWLALHKLRVERERACDDLVLTAGERASAYAEHLLEIARTLQTGTLVSAAAITMAKRSQLEGRLLAILDATRKRRGVTRRGLILGLMLLGAVMLPLLTIQLTQAKPSSAPGGKPAGAPSQPGDTLTFSSGVTARLLAVAMHPRRGNACWAPDGAPLSQVPKEFEKIDGTITPSRDQITREFYITVDHPVNIGIPSVTCEITSEGTSGGGTFGNVSGHMRMLRQAALPAGMKEATLRIGIASGPWETLRSASGEADGQNFFHNGQPHSIVFSKALQDGDKVVLTVSDDLSAQAKHDEPDYQIIAIDHAGKKHQARERGSNMGRFRQTTCEFDNLKLNQVERFEFQVRDYEWREIKGIRLNPIRAATPIPSSAVTTRSQDASVDTTKKPRTFDYTFVYERRIFGKSPSEAARESQGLPDEATRKDHMNKIMHDQILKQRQRVRTDGHGVRYEVIEDLGSPEDAQNPQEAELARQNRTSTYVFDGKAMADINRFENTATIMSTGFAYPNLAFLMAPPVNATAYKSIELKDVRPIKGYQIPFQIVTRSSQMEEKITIEKIDVDISFKDGLFDISKAIPPGTEVADTRETPMKSYKMPAQTNQLDSKSSSSQPTIGGRRPDSNPQRPGIPMRFLADRSKPLSGSMNQEGEYHWLIDTVQPIRVGQGWFGLREDGTFAEHTGGGVEKRAVHGPAELTLKLAYENSGKTLKITATEQWQTTVTIANRSLAVPTINLVGKVKVPEQTVLESSWLQRPIAMDGRQFNALWEGRFIGNGGKTLKTIVYAVFAGNEGSTVTEHFEPIFMQKADGTITPPVSRLKQGDASQLQKSDDDGHPSAAVNVEELKSIFEKKEQSIHTLKVEWEENIEGPLWDKDPDSGGGGALVPYTWSQFAYQDKNIIHHKAARHDDGKLRKMLQFWDGKVYKRFDVQNNYGVISDKLPKFFGTTGESPFDVALIRTRDADGLFMTDLLRFPNVRVERVKDAQGRELLLIASALGQGQKVWLDPAKAMLVVKMEAGPYTWQVLEDREVMPGLRLPIHYQRIKKLGDNVAPELRGKVSVLEDYTIRQIEVNSTLSSELFRFEYPAGTNLENQITGKMETVGPTAVKREDQASSHGKALQLRWVASANDMQQAEQLPWFDAKVKEPKLWLLTEILLTGKDMAAVKVQPSTVGNDYMISLFLTDDAKDRFAKLTAQGVGRRLAIVVNGKVVSAPVVREKIAGGRVAISGNFSKEEAETLAAAIRSANPDLTSAPAEPGFGPVRELVLNQTGESCLIDFFNGLSPKIKV